MTPAGDARSLLGAARSRFAALPRPRRIAALASALWTVLVAAYAIGFLGGASQARGTVALDALFFLVTLVLPLILIWIAAFLAEELARQRNAIAALVDLAAPLTDALRETAARLEHAAPAPDASSGLALDRLLDGQDRIAAALAALEASPAPAPPPGAAPQPRPARIAEPRQTSPQARSPGPPAPGRLDLPRPCPSPTCRCSPSPRRKRRSAGTT